MSITRFDSFINNHAQKILVKLQEKKSIENLLFDFLNEYNNNILANIFESTTSTGAPAAPRPAAPSSSASRPTPPAPGTPQPPAPGAPRPSAPPGTAPSAAKKIIDDNKEKFKTILKATVTNKVFEMGTELSKHFADEKKAGMAQNYYVVLKNIKEKLIKFLDKRETFNENTSHNSFKNFLENNSNKFELSKLSSAVLFDPKNTQEYLCEYILKNNIIIKESTKTATFKFGNREHFGTEEAQKNNLEVVFSKITNSIKEKITEIQNKIPVQSTEKPAIEKYFTNLQNKIKEELASNILRTIYTDMKPVTHTDPEAKTQWQKEQQQKRYKSIIDHSQSLKGLFEFVKDRKEYALDKRDLKKPSLYDALESVAHPVDQGPGSINYIIRFILEDNILEVYHDHYKPYNLSKEELEAIFCGIYGESKTYFEQYYKNLLISPYSQNKDKPDIERLHRYAASRSFKQEDQRKLTFKYIKKGIAGDDVKENYFNEKDLIYIFNKYVNDPKYEDELDDISLYNKPIRTLLEYYKNQNYFDPKNADYKSALETSATFDLEIDDDNWDNIEISDEDSYDLDMMGADTLDLMTEEETAAKEAKKLVDNGKVKLDDPLSKIKTMFAVDDDDIKLHDNYLIELALYRMCINHRGLRELSEDDLKIILVHDFPETDSKDQKRILTDEEAKNLHEIFLDRGRNTTFYSAYRYLARNKGNWKKLQSMLVKH